MTDIPAEPKSEAHTNDRGALSLAADIVAAYVAHNSLPAAELPALLANVHRTVQGLARGGVDASSGAELPDEITQPTAAQVRKSVTPDAIVSFIDGKAYKTLKRHLGTHGLDPHSYRQRYGLPSDYPLVAPNYAAQRSALAKSIGLGLPGSRLQKAESAEEPKKGSRRKVA